MTEKEKKKKKYDDARAVLLDNTEQLMFEDELAFFILFTGFIRPVIFPPDKLRARRTCNIPHDMSSRRHLSFIGWSLNYIHPIKSALLPGRGGGTLWRRGMLCHVGHGMPETSSVSDYGGWYP